MIMVGWQLGDHTLIALSSNTLRLEALNISFCSFSENKILQLAQACHAAPQLAHAWLCHLLSIGCLSANLTSLALFCIHRSAWRFLASTSTAVAV